MSKLTPSGGSTNIPSSFHLPSSSGSFGLSSTGIFSTPSSLSASGGSVTIPFNNYSGSSSSNPLAHVVSPNLNIPDFKIEDWSKSKCNQACDNLYKSNVFDAPHCNTNVVISPVFAGEHSGDCMKIEKRLYDCRGDCNKLK